MKQHFKLLSSERGESLVMVLVAVGVTAILSLGLATIMSNSSKETSRLMQKLELISLRRSLEILLSNPETCSCQMQGLSIKSLAGTPNSVSIPSIKLGCGSASSPLVTQNSPLPGSETGLGIGAISLKDVKLVSAPDIYSATLVVDPDDKTTKFSFRDLTVKQVFKTDSSGKIVSCTNDPDSVRDCDISEIMTGIDANGFPICRPKPNTNCPNGTVLQSVSMDGKPRCVDGQSIANIPVTSKTTYITTTSPATSTVSSASTAVTSITTPSTTLPTPSGPTSTVAQVLNASGNPINNCDPSEARKDTACFNQCVSEGAASGSFSNKNCDRGYLQCTCSNTPLRAIATTVNSGGVPSCTSSSTEKQNKCNTACIASGAKSGVYESCSGAGVANCICSK